MKSIISEEDLNVNSGYFAIKFTADWCGPCKKQQPNIEKMEVEFPIVQFLEVDADKFPSLVQKFGIKSLPTLVLVKDGSVITKIVGVTLIAGLRTSFINFTKEI